MEKRHLLITGLPGAGKTTLMIRLARRFAHLHPAGFYTEEIREGGVRKGFRLVGLEGMTRIIAHVDFPGYYRVGRYGVDVAGFEEYLAAADLTGSAAPLLFLDEVGKMECLSTRFVTLVSALLDSGKTVVATVARQGAGLIADLKSRPDCEIREITAENRERLLEELAEWIDKLHSFSRASSVRR